MAHPHDDGGPDPADGQGTPEGRRRGRILIPLGLLLVAAALVTYMLVVAQSGSDEDDRSNDNEGLAAVTVLDGAVPALV